MDVFDLYAKISLDSSEYDQGLEDAGGKANIFAGVLKANLVTKGIGVAIDALKELGKVAVDVFKESINAYAEYEQLAGGSQLVFGEAYDYISKKAQDAFKNMQMSQNEYLAQVNGLAVGLKSALGGDANAAAELADKIVTAEADVVAAMGITQEAAQNAFNGIMKGNFTMVDNLGLGITATKEGIQEMIDKVNEWNAAQGETTQYTMDNVADIQSALVDYIEMQGLAGYASQEGADTLSGSVSTMKAAWNNLVAGFSDGNADIDKLLDDLVEAAENAWNKFEPIASKALDRMIEALFKAVPKFAELGLEIGGAILEGLLKILLKPITWIMDLLNLGDFTYDVDEWKPSARANGGSALGNRPYIAGELGPELVVPSTTSHVYTASETRDMLGAQSININIQGDVYDDERSMRDKMTSAVIDIMGREMAYG